MLVVVQKKANRCPSAMARDANPGLRARNDASFLVRPWGWDGASAAEKVVKRRSPVLTKDSGTGAALSHLVASSRFETWAKAADAT
jgi:hypothetical protein